MYVTNIEVERLFLSCTENITNIRCCNKLNPSELKIQFKPQFIQNVTIGIGHVFLLRRTQALAKVTTQMVKLFD